LPLTGRPKLINERWHNSVTAIARRELGFYRAGFGAEFTE
jgi:hypothetical protein